MGKSLTRTAVFRRFGVPVLALLAVVIASAWLRWPGFTQGGFASHDVAGILYNGMLLAAGKLPFRDSFEFKAPGSFYLAFLFAGPQARDIAAFQVWANLWALAGLVAVGVIGWKLYRRPWAGVIAAGVYGLLDAQLDSMDANYVTWAQLPAIAAFGVGAWARGSTGSARLWRFFAAGVLAALAFAMKRLGGAVLGPVMLLALVPMAVPGRGRLGLGLPRARQGADLAAVLLGAVASHVPLVAHYGVFGALKDLVRSYPINAWGLTYVAQGGGGQGFELLEACLATVHFLGLPLILAAFSLGAAAGHVRGQALAQPGDAPQTDAARPTRDDRGAVLWLALWALFTLAAAWVGGRYYKGYFLAASAPLALLAASPAGLLGSRCALRWWARCIAFVPVVLLTVRQGAMLAQTRADRFVPHDQGGRVIAKHLLANLPPDARIWVWGWHLWDVYPLTGHLSASRIYKSLSVLTQIPEDTWRRPANRLRFVEGPAAAELMADFAAHPPAYIVLGSTAPHREFKALRELLARDYVRDRRVHLGRVEFWRARSLPAVAGL